MQRSQTLTFGPPDQDNIPKTANGMWGVSLRVRGAELNWRVPDGYWISAATKFVVDYARLIAAELFRLPHRYGYDPASTYTVLAQTWDRATEPLPSLALGRDVRGHEEVGLIPDAYYIESSGYADLYSFSLRSPKWSRRSSEVVWRGSVTGQGNVASPSDIPRVKLALACRDIVGVDVALTGVHETMKFPRHELTEFLEDEHLLSTGWPIRDFALHKFTLDIDGHANAWGLLEKLIFGCCVLKVSSPFEQWFYPRLHPWEHYVPVSADLSDLSEAVQWCRDNDAHCEWIAANGARLAATLRLQAELPRSCLEFMRIARPAPG